MPLLDIQNLETTFETEEGPVRAVRGVDLAVERNTRHAVIGQSGAGKSILALSIARLLPDNARLTGSIRYKGRELLSSRAATLRQIRGKEIMIIFQNPAAALNPVRTIESQICEMPRFHENVSMGQARKRAVSSLALCGFPDPEHILSAYPFELSGGMLQRAAIAMGIICRPCLLIADEPFKGLDARLQKQAAAALYKVCRQLSITLLIITHNLKIAQSLCDVVSVMHEGNIVETAEKDRFFSGPRHAYSERLVNAFYQFGAMENCTASSTG